MMEMFIEGQQADVSNEISTLLTFAIDDIKDFGSKNTTFSKTIVLPGTKRNNKLFGNIFQITSGAGFDNTAANIGYNFNAAMQAAAYIFTGNLQAFKGVLRLLEIVVDNGAIEYECAVFGELGGFVAKMGNSKLQELDFSAYDHTYSVANITATWDTAAAGSGYYYPLIDYGGYSSNKKDWRVNTFRPALYAKEYIDKIFEAAGYTYDCALFDTTRFEGIIVPHGQKILTADNTNLLNKTSLTNSFEAGGSTVAVEFNAPGGTLGAFTSASNQTFTFANATSVTADIAFNIYIENSSSLFIDFLKNTVSIFNSYFTAGDGWYRFDIPGVSLANGDVVGLVIGGLSSGQTYTYSADISIISFSAVPTPIQLGDTVRMNNCIPKGYLQKDFLSGILKLFNLYVFEDYEQDRVLKIEPFVDYYADAISVDWSHKVDRSKPMRIKPMSELNSRYFEFNFKSDSDYYNDLYKKRYNQGYGDYRYDSEFEFAKEVQKVELIFSGTPLVGYGGEDKVYSTIFKWNGGVVGSGEEQIDSNIRLLQAKKITGVASWAIKSFDGTSTLTTLTTYGYAGHLDDPDAPANDLQFGVPYELFFVLATGALNVNQFNVYWSSYMAEITDKDSRLLICAMWLSNRDIYQLNFRTRIYIDGVLYRLNKIADYNATSPDTCQVELLKVINRIY